MKLIKAIVFHKRIWPKNNSFRYNCNYISIKFPINEKKTNLFSLNKFNILSINEKDYANGNKNLFEWCKQIVKNKYEDDIDSVELITMPRILGYAFNPVSFMFCYSGKNLISTILKVNNTFSENHYYINCAIKDSKKYEQNYNIEKIFHVSPFLPREGIYKFKYKNNDDCIKFNIDYYNDEGENILETSVSGKKLIVENNYSLLTNILNTAYLVSRVIYLIHFQAVKLFFKKVKFYKKPKQNTKRIT
ncbi:DUF1365 domain-containing protein [Gammaproteobacteria bacterium]|nr:DUF1365 domain-containing protein [Gammaproteobacteria bacterium]